MDNTSLGYSQNTMLGQWYGVYSWPAGKKIFGVSDNLILTNLTPMQGGYLQSLCKNHSDSMSAFSEVILATQYVEKDGNYFQIQHLLLGNASDEVMKNIIGMFTDFKYLLPITNTRCVFESGFKVYAIKFYDSDTMLINKIGGKKILICRKVLSEMELAIKLVETGLNADGGGPIVHGLL